MMSFNTAHKTALALLGSVLLTLTSNAQTTGSDVESQLLLCAGRVTDSARLACYDGLVESLRPAGPRTQAETKTEEATDAEQGQMQVDNTTGVPLPKVENTPAKRNTETFDTDVVQKQSIRIMIEKTKRNARGDWYFYFDNGEVWKQIDTKGRRIPPLPIAATVSRGIFSSHKLHIDGQVWSMKIRRVK